MGAYRNISLSFWNDPKVYDDFNSEDKYMYLYFLTNPHTNICGCYEVGMKQIAQETGYDAELVANAINRLENKHDVLRYCPDTKEILIKNWWKYNWGKSPKVLSAVMSVSKHIRNDEFREYVQRMVDSVCETETSTETVNSNQIQKSDTVNRYSKQIQKSDTDTDTDVSIEYGYPMDTLSETDTELDLSNQKDRFELFWKAYPRKIGKDEAKAEFELSDYPLSAMLNAIAWYKGTDTWKKDNGQFIPAPARWIRERRWEKVPAQYLGFVPGKNEREAVKRMMEQRKKGQDNGISE